MCAFFLFPPPLPPRENGEQEVREPHFDGRPKEEQEKIEWTRYRRFQGRIKVDPKGGAFRVARDWRDEKNTIWTDGSAWRMGGWAVAVWWREAGMEPPWIGPGTGRRYTPGRREAGWAGRRYHLSRNKEAFDAELSALYQATKILDERGEEG